MGMLIKEPLKYCMYSMFKMTLAPDSFEGNEGLGAVELVQAPKATKNGWEVVIFKAKASPRSICWI